MLPSAYAKMGTAQPVSPMLSGYIRLYPDINGYKRVLSNGGALLSGQHVTSAV